MIKAGKPRNWKSTDPNLAQLFKDLHDCQVFASEEEKELIKLNKAGDIEARNLLIRSQLKWVMKCCTKRAGRDTFLAYELFTEVGIDAVIISVKNVDPEKGRLVTYVTRVLRNKFITFFKNYGATVIALPINGVRAGDPNLPRYEERTKALRELSDKAKKLESIHVSHTNDETEEGVLPLHKDKIQLALVDQPKDQRYSYDADEFWEVIKEIGVNANEFSALQEFSFHKQSPPYKSETARKKAHNISVQKRNVRRMGIAKIRDAFNRISGETIMNVSEFIQKFKEVG